MEDRKKAYLWAEIGAFAGAIVFGIPAGLGWMAAIMPFLFTADGWYLVFVSGVALTVVLVGSALGCRFALRRRDLPGADRTAILLAVLLAGLYLVGLWSSDTSLQSDLLPYLAAAAPLMPLLARMLSELHRH